MQNTLHSVSKSTATEAHKYYTLSKNGQFLMINVVHLSTRKLKSPASFSHGTHRTIFFIDVSVHNIGWDWTIFV